VTKVLFKSIRWCKPKYIIKFIIRNILWCEQLFATFNYQSISFNSNRKVFPYLKWETAIINQVFFKIKCMSRPNLTYFCFRLMHHLKHRRIHLSMESHLFKPLHTLVYTVVCKHLYTCVYYGIY